MPRLRWCKLTRGCVSGAAAAGVGSVAIEREGGSTIISIAEA